MPRAKKAAAVVEEETSLEQAEQLYTLVKLGGRSYEVVDQEHDTTFENLIDNSLDRRLDEIIAKGSMGRKRKHLHASDILRKEFKWNSTERDFCYRQCVLAGSELYEPVETFLDPHTRAVYENGEAIHGRYQRWFEMAQVSLGTEVRHMEVGTGLRLTTDAIVDLYENGVPYIAEIKGYKLKTYNKLVYTTLPDRYRHKPGVYRKEPPEDAHRQLQLYMHMTGIHQGFVLVECKDDQYYHAWECEYNPDVIEDIIIRVNTTDVMVKSHVRTGNLPERICESKECTRARECSMRDACFMGETTRQQYRQWRLRQITVHDVVGEETEEAERRYY